MAPTAFANWAATAPDASAATQDQHAVERTDLGAAVQAHPRRDPRHRHGCDLGEIELVGDLEQPVAGNRDLAAIRAGAHDAKAAAANQHWPAIGMTAGLGTGSPRKVGRRSAGRALRDPHVERIDGRIGDVDDLFAGSRLRIGELVELKCAADGVKSCCAHRATVGRAIADTPSR